MGFSHSTCRPARRQAMVCGACRNTGVATYTASAPDSASAPSRSLHAGTFQAAALAGSRVTTPTSRLRGSARIAGSTRFLAISPMPISSHPQFAPGTSLARHPFDGFRSADGLQRRAEFLVRTHLFGNVQQYREVADHLQPQPYLRLARLAAE